MVRKGWTKIEVQKVGHRSSGTDVLDSEVSVRRPTPSGFFKGDPLESRPQVQSKTVHFPSKGQSKVDGLQIASQTLGPEDSRIRSSLVETIKIRRTEVSKLLSPQKVAEVAARVDRLEAALTLSDEDDPDAEPLKVSLKQAKLHARCNQLESVSICVFSTSPA